VDRRGVRMAQLRLPDNQRVVGFGTASVYVAIGDDDGLERLQRHPW
jgi:hypothetical protein